MSHPELDQLADSLLLEARQTLAGRGAFAPFGLSLNGDGEIAAVDTSSFHEQGRSQKFVDSMSAALQRQAAAGEIRAAGICCDMRLLRPVFLVYTPTAVERLDAAGIWCDVREVLPGAAKPCRVIRLNLEHCSGEAADMFLPYTKPWFGKIRYRDPITRLRAARIFLQAGDGEKFELADAKGLIDVRGDDFDSMLFVDGRPIALNWSQCTPTVEQYLVRAGAADCEDRLRALRQVLEGDLRRDESIRSQILPFLDLFVPGRYRIQYRELVPDCRYLQFDASWDELKSYDAFYPLSPHYGVLVFTQALTALNQERVAYYLNCLQKGGRPIALTATVEDGWCNFVLDGHHKLEAYKLAKIAPTFISVCRLDAPRLPAGTFEQYFDATHPLASHYADVKAKYGLGNSKA